MSSVLNNEQLSEITRTLEKKVEQLAVPYEDALAHRIFDKVQATFRAWLAMWLGVFSLVAGLVGYVGYAEVVDAGKKKIEEQIASQVTTQLQDEVKDELTKVREQIKKALLKSSLEDVSRLDVDLAQLLSDTQNVIDQRIKAFAAKLTPALKEPDQPLTLSEKPKQSSLSGFAFFGIQSDGSWSEKNFKIIGKAENASLAAGDLVEAVVPVNARQGVIELTKRGYVNKPTVGLIRPGRKLKVIQVSTVAGGAYVWFQFESVN